MRPAPTTLLPGKLGISDMHYDICDQLEVEGDPDLARIGVSFGP